MDGLSPKLGQCQGQNGVRCYGCVENDLIQHPCKYQSFVASSIDVRRNGQNGLTKSGRTDGRTDGRKDGRTGESLYAPTS